LNVLKDFFYGRNLKADSMLAGFKFMLIGKGIGFEYAVEGRF
jgi:hypothetical protein